MVRRVVSASSPPEPLAPVGFGARLALAFGVFFRLLADGLFARRVLGVVAGAPAELPAPPSKEAKEAKEDAPRQAPAAPKAAAPRDDGAALQLLALLQREGRFVDFLEEDVATFSDADIGAAARVVHEGCRRALREHVTLEPVRAEDEGARVAVAAADGVRSGAVKLTGSVPDDASVEGTLRHKGWRARAVRLPQPTPGFDATVVAPAEVEVP